MGQEEGIGSTVIVCTSPAGKDGISLDLSDIRLAENSTSVLRDGSGVIATGALVEAWGIPESCVFPEHRLEKIGLASRRQARSRASVSGIPTI
jgi:hypothetical protein